MRMTNWRKLLTGLMNENGETLDDIQSNTMTDAEMDTMFDDDYGGKEGCPFTVWTDKFVYFPGCYDGSEWVSCVSRHPNGVPTRHVGGG